MNFNLRNFLWKGGFYIKLLLLSPGIVVHELAHIIFCLISGIKIRSFRLFRFSELAGYVEHDEPDDLLSAFVISFGPLFLNTLISFWLFQKFSMNLTEWKNILYLYLAISIGLSAIPSDIDGESFGGYIKRRIKKNFLFFPLLILMPIVWVLNFSNYLKRFYFDYLFTFAIFYLALFIY